MGLFEPSTRPRPTPKLLIFYSHSIMPLQTNSIDNTVTTISRPTCPNKAGLDYSLIQRIRQGLGKTFIGTWKKQFFGQRKNRRRNKPKNPLKQQEPCVGEECSRNGEAVNVFRTDGQFYEGVIIAGPHNNFMGEDTYKIQWRGSRPADWVPERRIRTIEDTQ